MDGFIKLVMLDQTAMPVSELCDNYKTKNSQFIIPTVDVYAEHNFYVKCKVCFKKQIIINVADISRVICEPSYISVYNMHIDWFRQAVDMCNNFFNNFTSEDSMLEKFYRSINKNCTSDVADQIKCFMLHMRDGEEYMIDYSCLDELENVLLKNKEDKITTI